MLGKKLIGPDVRSQLFENSPVLVKRLFGNVEALRRDRFRRYGNYRRQLAFYDAFWYSESEEKQRAFQCEALRELLQAAQRTPFYGPKLAGETIVTLEDVAQLPLLTKADIRKDPLALIQPGLKTSEMWLAKSSGSTGTPIRYYQGRATIRAHQAVIDALLSWHGCGFGQRRVRFSGALVIPYQQTRPPFWLYIDVYRQLQCSAYHLSAANCPIYLEAISNAQVQYATGYATAWHLLATYILSSGARPPALQAIFTDSEGISFEAQEAVEAAFRCPVYQTYGLVEAGQVGMQCAARRYHVLTKNSLIEVVDPEGRPVPAGTLGEIVVTDLSSLEAPLIRYRTGDLGVLAADPCSCGWHSPSLTEIVGRIDDQVCTPEGRWVGRLSHVAKVFRGVRESQIAQVAVDRIVLRVVPDHDFDPESVEVAIATTKKYVGNSMDVSWEAVDALARSRSGKLRHVVREFNAKSAVSEGTSTSPQAALLQVN